MVLLVIVLACSAPPAGAVEGPTLVLSARHGDPHAASLHADEPMEVVCVDADGLDPRPSFSLTADAVLRGLLADTSYRCVGTLAGGQAVRSSGITTDALPDSLPVPVLVTPDAEAGWHLTNLTAPAGGWVVILDEEGRVRWQLFGAQFPGGLDATWMNPGVMVGGKNVAPRVVNLDGDVVWEAAATPGSEGDVAGGWTHDAGPSADGASVYALADESMIHEDGTHTKGFVVKQLSRADGSLLWSWSSFEDGAGLLDPIGTDPFHANAVWDVDGRVLVNVRNLSQVLAVDPATKAVVWRLGRDGDFTLLEADGSVAEPERWFRFEHDTKLIDGRLYLFDNSMAGGRPTRALVLAVDEAARTAQIVREWTRLFDGEDWHAKGWGGVDPLPDGGLSVAFGNNEAPASTLFHVDPASDAITWEVALPVGVGLYRSDRLEPFLWEESLAGG